MNQKYEPTRMCIACRMRFAKAELNRYVIQISDSVNIDESNSSANTQKVLDKNMSLQGRGFYVCNNPICIDKFQKIKIRKPKLKLMQHKSKKV